MFRIRRHAYIRKVFAIAWLMAGGIVRANVIDGIDVRRHGAEAEILVRFNTPVQYLRHAPANSGALLRVSLRTTGAGIQPTGAFPESMRLPETDLVPPATVTYADAEGALNVAFDQPASFSVRQGADGSSVSIVLPVPPEAKDWVVQVKGPPRREQADARVASSPAPAGNTPVAAGAEQAVLPAVAAAGNASGRVLDRVDVERRGNEADITIRFAVPVRYRRHLPDTYGNSLRIDADLEHPASRPGPSVAGTHRLPETDMVPRFSIRYPDQEDSLLVLFDQQTRFAVAAGVDGRSIVVKVPVLPGARDWSVQIRDIPAPVIVAALSTRSAPEKDFLPVPPPKPAASPPAPGSAVGAPPAAQFGPALAVAEPQLVPLRPSVAPRSVPERALPAQSMVPIGSVGTNTESQPAAGPRLQSPRPVPGSALPVQLAAQPGPALKLSTELAPSGPAKQESPLVPTGDPAPVTGARPGAALPAASMENMPEIPPLSAEEIETMARDWLSIARQAIESRRGVVAAERLNQILSLPPNTQTQVAQALIGEARELSGELNKAKVEYELYLKLYPNGNEAPRVRERLAALGKSVQQAVVGPGLRADPGSSAWTTFGSVAAYLYRGQSKIETLTPPPPGQLPFDKETLSLQDQNSLLSTVDLQMRRRDATTDTRIVFRDQDLHSFLSGQRSYNRLNAAFFEQTDRSLGYFVRAGRQVGTGGGVFGRFDGLLAGYNLNPSWRVNGVFGTVVEFNSPFNRSFYGASADFTPQQGRPGFSAYYIEQTLDGLSDRKAVGGEVRYFDTHSTVFGMFDYDLNFKQINIAMMQGNWRSDGGTNYFANFDFRRSPPLSLSTALPGQVTADGFPNFDPRSVAANLGVDEMRNQASILTASSYMYSAGFTHPVTTRWQLGADYRLFDVTGTGASGVLPAQPGSGTSHVLSGQALGNSLWLANDATVLNASVILAPTFKGQSYNLTYVLPYNAWRVDGIFRYYTQLDDQSQKQNRLGATLRVNYRWKNDFSVELEVGNEIFDETGPLRETHSVRRYVYSGLRWDFR